MTAAAQKIEKEIQELSLDDMVALHDRLVSAIGVKERSGRLDPSYVDEIQRRVREIKNGTAKGRDAFQALKEM